MEQQAAGPAGLEESAMWLMARIVQQIRARTTDRQAEEQTSITPREFVVLSTADGRALTQLELGQAAGIDKSTLVITLDDLERRGLVCRRPAPADRRRRVIEITGAGRDALAQVGRLMREVENEVLGGLAADEREELLAFLRRVVTTEMTESRPQGSCV
ncbi:MarR family transcriptional regulator [Nonomuraea mesophila]|uniref:MarR family transcriptional regulator n=1 Tax=Nonomuraea mesophila TaxID=2530382 RepID=A0A4R5FVL9_9ACTN|nr:MarR family winged helix-turn-helix transcriptional regulator [Nonomuraea mesophila]TDE57911.1 MarR family transcriptional regulator [Nonomuraea mesophila]